MSENLNKIILDIRGTQLILPSNHIFFSYSNKLQSEINLRNILLQKQQHVSNIIDVDTNPLSIHSIINYLKYSKEKNNYNEDINEQIQSLYKEYIKYNPDILSSMIFLDFSSDFISEIIDS